MSDKAQSVVVVGAGLAGLATALGAALRGMDVTVLEAADQVGGAAAFSGGMVWAGGTHVARREGIDDDLDRTEQYVRDIASHSHPELLDEAAMLRWIRTAPEAIAYWEQVGAIQWEVIPGLADYHGDSPGAQPVGRYLTAAVVDGARLGQWRSRLRVSPYFPVGSTYADMLARGRRSTSVTAKDGGPRDDLAAHAGAPALGRAGGPVTDTTRDDGDPLTFGTGVVAAFLARVLAEERVSIRLGHKVTELIQNDDGAVVGARACGPDGVSEHHGVVVLATSGYDWDAELVREVLGLDPDDFGSVAPQSVAGDGIRLARQVGAAVDRIPGTAVPMVPGWWLGDGYGYGPEFALPHSMMVDRSGRRFCDDSYWVDIVRTIMAPGAEHLPFFLIWDEQHHRKYGLGDCPPGADYPDGVVTTAGSLAELGAALGIDGAQLERTAEEFSQHARNGQDPAYGRGTSEYILSLSGDRNHQPNGLLGPIEEPPFHGLRLRLVGTGIGMSGISIDDIGRVRRGDGSGTATRRA